METIKRGDIYYADLSPVVGSEQGGTRPVIVLQNNTGNRFSPTIIVAPFTSNKGKKMLPTHLLMKSEETGLPKDSIVLLEQVRSIDKSRLVSENVGKIRNLDTLNEIIKVAFFG